MLKKIKDELATRKGVRSGPKGGSLNFEHEGVEYVPSCPEAYVAGQWFIEGKRMKDYLITVNIPTFPRNDPFFLQLLIICTHPFFLKVKVT
jgi:hypothetical protein